MCFHTMPRRKDISNALGEAIISAHGTGKGYKAISHQCKVHHSTVRKIIQKWKIDAPANSPQGQTVQCSEKLQETQELGSTATGTGSLAVTELTMNTVYQSIRESNVRPSAQQLKLGRN